jgi:hypothetical protein
MSVDPMFYVRKEAATAVGSLATSVEPDIALEKLVSHTLDSKMTYVILTSLLATPLFEIIR